MNSMQSYSSSRRSDRGYSHEYDSRSNRGSSRGGRGGRGGGGSGGGRNNSISGTNRYSNRRGQHDRSGGDDNEDDYRNVKYHVGGRGTNRNHPQSHKGKDYKPRVDLKDKDSHHQPQDHANSIDRGEQLEL